MIGPCFSDRVKLALLCDYALTSQDGKVSVIGIFSTITFASLPATYPRFYVAAILALDPGQYAAQLQLITPTGADMLPNAPPLNVDVPVVGIETNLIIGFDNLHFEVPGLYQVQLRVGSDLTLTIPFTVMTGAMDQPEQRGHA
jgi:hypothetical protein